LLKWIEIKLNDLTKDVTVNMDNYQLDKATRPIMDFVEDLSTWYLRRCRDRFKDTTESELASAMNEIVRLLSLMRNDGGMADSAGRVRVAIETGSVGITGTNTLTTLTTLSNQTSSGGYQTTMATFAASNNSPKFNRQYITVT
jgi:methionyl-tRNA synthetase